MVKVNGFNKDDLKIIYSEISQSLEIFKSKLNFFNRMEPIFKIMLDGLVSQQRMVTSLLASGEKQTEILKVYSGFTDSVLKMEQSFSEDVKNISQQLSTIEKNIEEDYEKLKLLEKPSSFKRK